MFDFLNIEPESFGLDFSDLSLKIIKLKRKGKFLTLASWGETDLKPGIIQGGEIKNEKALVEAIKKALTSVKGEKLKTKNVVASLPEKKAFFQVIQMPKMSEEELKTAVPFEAENYIPLSAKDVYLDFQIIPSLNYSSSVGVLPKDIKNKKERYKKEKENSVNENILVSAFPKKIIDAYLACLKKSGLIVQALEVESQSIVRALIKNSVSPFSLFIIDFGRSTTSFIFFLGYSIYFTSSVSISSQDITKSISRALKVDLVKAEELKRKYGFVSLDQIQSEKNNYSKQEIEESKKVFEAAKPVLMNLVQEIKKHFRYCQTHMDYASHLPVGKKIKKIILCGRGANLKGISNFLFFELKVPVELGNPWVNILPEPLKEVPEISYKESLGYTTALGLALRGIKG